MRLTRSILAQLCLLSVLCFSPSCFAWGAGHEDVAAAIFERLPDGLRRQFTPETVRQAVSHDSLYPDSMEPFDVDRIGDEAMRRLKAHDIKKRHDIHSDTGRAVAFGLLVDALRGKQFKRVALWIAALSHSTADMAACNHDSLVHTATYGWAAWGLKLPGGAPFKLVKPLLDLHAVVSDNPAGKAAFAKVIKAMSLHDDQRDAATTLLEIMLYGHEGARFCGPRGTAIMAGAAGWVDRQDIAARELLRKNMAELGAWAVIRTVRDVEVASRLARGNVSIEPTSALKAAYQERLMALVRESRLAEDSLFAPLLHDKPVGAAPVVGVVMEPTWRMNDAMLGFSSRVTAASIARTLQQTGRAYVTLDVRDMISAGFPPPDKVPVVIVVAANFGSYQQMKTGDFDDRIAGYLARGGRVVWIGGTAKPPSKSLGVIARAMKKGDAQMLPVSEDVFVRSRLRVAFGNGGESWKVAHSPRTPAGWQQPICPWQFDSEPGDNLEPALKLDGPGSLRIVGVIAKDHKLAFLPIYAVTPWLLEGSDFVTAASEPALDAASRTILFSMLERLK